MQNLEDFFRPVPASVCPVQEEGLNQSRYEPMIFVEVQSDTDSHGRPKKTDK